MALLKTRHLVAVAFVVVQVTCLRRLAAQQRQVGEDDLKAAFLYNFAKYVEWPPSAFAGTSPETFRLCVVADPPFVKMVHDIVAAETIDDRPVVLLMPEGAEAARRCHILFIGGDERDRAPGLLSAVQSSPVLTVGNGVEFLDLGGIVGFVRDGTRVRFDVNTAVARRVGLAISSRLLRIARRVTSAVPER
jgi:hypothetical protein